MEELRDEAGVLAGVEVVVVIMMMMLVLTVTVCVLAAVCAPSRPVEREKVQCTSRGRHDNAVEVAMRLLARDGRPDGNPGGLPSTYHLPPTSTTITTYIVTITAVSTTLFPPPCLSLLGPSACGTTMPPCSSCQSP